MQDDQSATLVILAGGQSSRMGTDKAIVLFEQQRLIDRVIDQYRELADPIYLSASQNYGTELINIPDNPASPPGPVGGIFSISEFLQKLDAKCPGFCTVPVDAPFVPENLVSRLSASGACAVASTQHQLQPAFAYWQCKIVNAVQATHDTGSKAPSLHWLVRQCGAEIVEWDDETTFANINSPDDLAAVESYSKSTS